MRGNTVHVNTTSRSHEEWSTGLSPFFLGPVSLPDDTIAENVENAWQFCKVYANHADPVTYKPTNAYWDFAREGWANKKAIRYPMGRDAKPLYSYWKGEKLGYVEARIQIYCPIYANSVQKSVAFQKLKKIYEQAKGDIALFDFDGYDYLAKGYTFQDVLFDEKLKMGHSFVLAGLLKGDPFWEHPDPKKT